MQHAAKCEALSSWKEATAQVWNISGLAGIFRNLGLVIYYDMLLCLIIVWEKVSPVDANVNDP